ncbi:MAG: hypothetical protein IT378_24700 [Sandaracinaceae bacterium]|nr:hypothetical protein [Sandaracinaceae bacterium]
MKTTRNVLVIGLALSLGGCFGLSWRGSDGSDDGSSDLYDGYDPALESAVSVEASSLRGDLGLVRGFDVAPGALEGWRSGFGELHVTVDGRTPDGQRVMAIVLASPELVESEVGTTTRHVLYSAEGYGPIVDVVGCSASGANGEYLDFDVQATEVEAQIERADLEGMRRLRFVATFESEHGAQRASGSFDYPVAGTQSGTTAPGR